MSFSTDLAELVANQLSRCVTLRPHHLAGQVANLDFWVGQVRHALDAIDEYGMRFTRLKYAQQRYADIHQVKDSMYDEFSGARERTPAPPRRVSAHDLNKARRQLIEAVTHFLARCRNERLVTDEQLAGIASRLGLDPDSLHFPA